ncbi:outer membrane lipoprotein Blc [Halorhodospira halochloris]|uniref:Outer membrane lipoprotein Blc n=1 Tax=Halorhodospira halochloris TaxID=1052 RepID=A0A110B2G0_HALHR|nr:lipocalin family protein [Halorhodospira halochloris]MCG5548504.1 lipocalin family protein [Halorhodospira halochloris]BAU58645.1 outer membrane lipoprotein Blc [Halorhodospira halochloris]
MAVFLLSSCTGAPSGIEPVSDFDAERYTGKWYEIKRLDHRFERGLTHVTAEYQAQDDGTIKVINRGFDTDDCEWKSIEGTATFRESPDIASLRVVFFWPIAGGYHVIVLDDDYEWAMVSGPSRNYLWILAREPDLDEDVLSDLVTKAEEWGFAVDELVEVEHDGSPEDGVCP